MMCTECWEGGSARGGDNLIVLNKVIKIGIIERPIEKLTFEKILKTGDGVSKVALWKKSVPGRETARAISRNMLSFFLESRGPERQVVSGQGRQ